MNPDTTDPILELVYEVTGRPVEPAGASPDEASRSTPARTRLEGDNDPARDDGGARSVTRAAAAGD